MRNACPLKHCLRAKGALLLIVPLSPHQVRAKARDVFADHPRPEGRGYFSHYLPISLSSYHLTSIPFTPLSLYPVLPYHLISLSPYLPISYFPISLSPYFPSPYFPISSLQRHLINVNPRFRILTVFIPLRKYI